MSGARRPASPCAPGPRDVVDRGELIQAFADEGYECRFVDGAVEIKRPGESWQVAARLADFDRCARLVKK